MLVSLQADYALRLLIDVARHENDGKPLVTREIAERQHIPRVFLTKIVAHLSGLGLLETHRGKGGGVSLGKAAEDINVLEVIEAFEGNLAFNECTMDGERCENSHHCTVRPLWRAAEKQLRHFFRSRTLAELVVKSELTILPDIGSNGSGSAELAREVRVGKD
jgi:Rrf2 family protein